MNIGAFACGIFVVETCFSVAKQFNNEYADQAAKLLATGDLTICQWNHINTSRETLPFKRLTGTNE